MITTRSFAVLGALLALGLAVFGVQIGKAVRNGREFDRYFTVRGLSTREVKATLVIWPIRYAVSADDLPTLRQEIDRSKALVFAFLEQNRIATADCWSGIPAIEDRAAQYRDPNQLRLPRYNATLTLVVRSPQVDLVKHAIQQSDTLLNQGLALLADDYSNQTQFNFDALNEIKPAMIEEATANARAAAEKFAQDSHATVGRIRKATQGVVEITDRDIATPELKVVRVVTTVEFFIE